MRRLSNRILLYTGSLSLVTLLVICLAVLIAYHRQVDTRAHENLALGGSVFDQLLDFRNEQLLTAVAILADDFGFKTAVASNDRDTIRSALLNHSARIGADMAMVIALDGELVASTFDEPPIPGPIADLVAMTEQQGMALGTVIIQGQLYQLMMVSMLAPLPIARVAMGFVIDDALAASIQRLTGLEVSFWVYGQEDTPYLASTLPISARTALRQVLLEQQPDPGMVTLQLGDESYLSLFEWHREVGDHFKAVLQIPWLRILTPYRALQLQLLLLALGALVLTLLVALFIARSVTRPVQALASAAGRIEAGDYRQPVAVTTRDEIGQLARTFNRMQQGIAEREQHISHLAFHDTLTGLPNRVAALQRLDQCLDTSRRQHRTLALLLLDLDRFKEINDTLGQASADRVLQQFANGLRSPLLHDAGIARLGGDEFLLLLPDTDVTTARSLGATLHRTLQRISLDDSVLIVTFSIGIALFPDHGDNAETLLRRAGIALSDAKRNREAVAFYQAGQDEWHLRQLQLMSDLHRAVEQDELVLHYQPKLELASGRIAHVEALIRWQHPEYGFLPPGEFIPSAEQSGHMAQVSQWMLRHVARQLHDWRTRGLELAVAVNLSAVDLLDAELPDKINRWLQDNRVDPRYLLIEITESTAMRDLELTLPLLERLRQSGIALAIDDFGTGHSSLAQLKSLPFNELKIDKSFVQHLQAQGDDAVIVRTTIDLAHNMGLKVVAEGVETETALQLLKQYRCDLIQGYYLSRPLPAEQLISWLQQRQGV